MKQIHADTLVRAAMRLYPEAYTLVSKWVVICIPLGTINAMFLFSTDLMSS